MNKRNILIFSFGILIILIASAQIISPKEPTNEQPLYHIYKSFLRFDNLTHMYERSEYVIHGVVESSLVDATFKSNIHTMHTINVIEVLKGNNTDSMVVRQDGGVYNGETIRVKDVPMMKVGDELVLYLTYNPSYESYVVMGGPQGRFLIQDGKLYHITELDKSIQFVTPSLWTKGADASNLRQILTP